MTQKQFKIPPWLLALFALVVAFFLPVILLIDRITKSHSRVIHKRGAAADDEQRETEETLLDAESPPSDAAPPMREVVER